MANNKFKVCENCRTQYSYRLRKCPKQFCRGTVWRLPTCEEMDKAQKDRDEIEAILQRLMAS